MWFVISEWNGKTFGHKTLHDLDKRKGREQLATEKTRCKLTVEQYNLWSVNDIWSAIRQTRALSPLHQMPVASSTTNRMGACRSGRA